MTMGIATLVDPTTVTRRMHLRSRKTKFGIIGLGYAVLTRPMSHTEFSHRIGQCKGPQRLTGQYKPT